MQVAIKLFSSFLPIPFNCQLVRDENKSLISVIGIFVSEQSTCVDKENHILSYWNLFLLKNKIRSIILNHLEDLLSCKHW